MNFQNPIKVSSKITFNDIKNENPQKYKTILCKHFSSPGGCILGNQCKFAHGLAELRHPNKNQGLKKEDVMNYIQKYCEYRIEIGQSTFSVYGPNGEKEKRPCLEVLKDIFDGKVSCNKKGDFIKTLI